MAYKWLDTALDYGLTEDFYWTSTLAEVIRAIESKKRQQKADAQEKAAFDYLLADLIGRSVSRIYSSSAHFPQLNEVYPSLFDTEEIKVQQAEKQAELTAVRFRAFAQAYNKKYKEVGAKNGND